MSNRESLKERLEIFFKGVFMGLADIIPGVSGGTIALITGIYERLIFAIKSIDPRLPLYVLKGNFKEARETFWDIDFFLLVPLVLGIGTAFLAASRVILIALNQFPAFTYSFFFGLILASAILIYRRIGEKSHKALFTGILGLMFAFWLVGQNAFQFNHTLPIIFVSGFIAICAMILPGISGSFMLLLLGQYEFLLSALKNFSTQYLILIVFMSGAIISILAFSRVLSYLLKNHEAATLAFLTGLMVGALRLPFEKVINVTEKYPELAFAWNIQNVLVTIIIGALGFIFVFVLERDQDYGGMDSSPLSD